MGISDFLEVEVIKEWIADSIPEELVVYAVQIAVCNNACSVKYIDTILQTWKRKNIKTISQAKKESNSFKNKKGLKNQERDKWENE